MIAETRWTLSYSAITAFTNQIIYRKTEDFNIVQLGAIEICMKVSKIQRVTLGMNSRSYSWDGFYAKNN